MDQHDNLYPGVPSDAGELGREVEIALVGGGARHMLSRPFFFSVHIMSGSKTAASAEPTSVRKSTERSVWPLVIGGSFKSGTVFCLLTLMVMHAGNVRC